MGDVNGMMTFELLMSGMTILRENSEERGCSGCNNSCSIKNKMDVVEHVKMKSKCCKKYKKKKSYCNRCPKKSKAVA